MGATCVGKKHFIRAASANPAAFGLPDGLLPTWIADGDLSVEQILEQAEHCPLIIRWQWGRESTLEKIRQQRPDVRQSLFVCKVNPSVQVQRVVAREGSLKWEERALIRESEDVEYLAQKLSMTHGLAVRYIDASKEYATS